MYNYAEHHIYCKIHRLSEASKPAELADVSQADAARSVDLEPLLSDAERAFLGPSSLEACFHLAFTCFDMVFGLFGPLEPISYGFWSRQELPRASRASAASCWTATRTSCGSWIVRSSNWTRLSWNLFINGKIIETPLDSMLLEAVSRPFRALN